MTDPKKRRQVNVSRQNVLESLKDIGTGASDEFFKQLLSTKPTSEKRSGSLSAGESISIPDVLSGRDEENRKLKSQITLERNLHSEEKRLTEEKIGKLRVQLQALISEISKLAVTTQDLAKETTIAVMQAPADPGVYHISFFENLLSFMQSFRKRIEEASLWLGATNKRAEKKNYWASYKNKGSSFLLAPDHYLQRSAG
jgi:hypothetical protein